MINFSLSPGVKFDADHTDDRIILIDGRIGDEYFPPVRRLFKTKVRVWAKPCYKGKRLTEMPAFGDQI